MFIKQKQINKYFVIFLLVHATVWTVIPSLTNLNLPLDTIEAIAWSSDIKWGYIKHPPLSAWFPGLLFKIFSNQDWVFYLLSQLFIILSFIVIWKFSEDFFKNKIHSLISVLILESIYFYNFTSPEFNVNICQLPFWALTVFYCWKAINKDKNSYWILFGIFAALGVLSKYIFFYLIISLGIFFTYKIFKNKKFNYGYFIAIVSFVIVLSPHLVWLVNNNFVTFDYALHRTSIGDISLLSHFLNPLIFFTKQLGILSGFIFMLIILIHNFKTKISFEDNKFLFLFATSILPIILLLLTSIITGTKIRTMWMTPFYLSIGVFCVYTFEIKIKKKAIKNFFNVLIIFFILFPSGYIFHSISKNNSRTDYPGKEIAKIVQQKWENKFSNEIKIVFGNEWDAGNLSYNLNSKPKWVNTLPTNIDVGIVVIGDYNHVKYVNDICLYPDENIVLFEIESFHNICMIGK